MPRTKKNNTNKKEEHYGFQNFNLVRRITRELFINGYRSYREYIELSPSTFYNRISLITNCLATCMEWPEQGYLWMSNNRMRIENNPLFVLYKARPMKNLYQYALHFAIMHMLSDGKSLSLAEISRLLADEYHISEDAEQKNKLQPRLEKYYLPSGLLIKDKNKKYSLSSFRIKSTDYIQGLLEIIPGINNAIAFFSEYSPVGIIGSYIMDAEREENKIFVFKHEYLSQVLDAQVLSAILGAIYNKQIIKIYVEHTSDTVVNIGRFLPLKILSETWFGRQYLFGYDPEQKEYRSLRIDYIERVTVLPADEGFKGDDVELIRNIGIRRINTMWSSSVRKNLHHVKVEFLYDKPYFYQQISRERKQGTITLRDDNRITYECDVDEPKEMTPWLLSHIGMISSITVTGGKTNSEDIKLLNRFKNHILDMHRAYNMNKITISSLKNRYKPIDNALWRKMNNGEDEADLFHHIFSEYVLRLQEVLELATIPKSKKEIMEIIKSVCENSLIDINTVISFDNLISSGMLIQTSRNGEDKYCSFVPGLNSPQFSRPLSNLEKSWLLAILDDEKVSLFIDSENILKAKRLLSDVTPLYSPKDIVYYDQYLDGDTFTEPEYYIKFRLLQKAISDGYRRVLVRYITENERKKGGDGYMYEVVPFKIEYSKLNNRFWLLCNIYDTPNGAPLLERESSLVSLRFANIMNVELLSEDTASPQYRYAFEQIFNEELSKYPIVIRLNDYGNAFERFMIAFSPYKKETKYDAEKNECKVKLWYSKNDKKDVLLKLRSFGKSIEILEPAKIRRDMIRRIEKQLEMMRMM